MRHRTAAHGGPHHLCVPIRLGLRFGTDPPGATAVKKKNICEKCLIISALINYLFNWIGMSL